MAAGATDALDIVGALLVLLGDRQPAGVALVIAAGLKIMVHRNALVEDETLAAPPAFRLRYPGKVVQYAPVQVIDLVKPELAQQGRGFLAADAAGTEHGHLAMPGRVEMVPDEIREFAEGPGMRVDGAFEGADLVLVVVARIHQQHVRIRQQRVPVLGFHPGPGHGAGVDAVNTHGDDFLFQFHLGAAERRRVVQRLLAFDGPDPRVVLEPLQHPVNAVPRSCDGAVDSLGRQQQGSPHPVFGHPCMQWPLEATVCIQTDELVQ